MADPINPRGPRTYDPQRPSGAEDTQRGGGGDPLAELARLIGQNDPFADFERKRAAGGETQPASRAAEAPYPQDWQEPAPPQAAYLDPYGAPAASDAYAAAQGAAPYPQPEQYPPGACAYPADQAQHYHPEQSQYSEQADAYNQGYDPYYDTGEPLDEGDYQEQEDRRRRNRRLAAVIGILALAVLGGAGAYGYRAFVGPTVSAAPPPVIKADTTPAKVIPSAQVGDSASNKLIYDRVGEPNQAERVVPREEKPVDIKTATVTQTPRVSYPAPDASAVAAPAAATIPVSGQAAGGQILPAASSMAPQGSGAVLPSAKKVRTVTIRPDMTMVPGAPSNPEPPMRTAPPPQTAELAPATRSIAVQPGPPPRAAPPPVPANEAATRGVTLPPAPARPAPPPPQRQTVAPLSLSPGDASPPPAPAPQRAAPARPAPAASQPVALAAAPPAGANEPQAAGGGSFMVQVSSQRSEADANASYQALQTRYPDVLGGRSSTVRRADLGSKGVYYRAMVGPFATGEQAVQFCTTLKTAGGQCVIHRN